MHMHDWTLLSITYEWKTARVVMSFETTQGRTESVSAEGVSDLRVPQKNAWGRSVSVNKVKGPHEDANGRKTLEIEMQTGDVVMIEALTFRIPASAGASKAREN
jgi:hypothetical protein